MGLLDVDSKQDPDVDRDELENDQIYADYVVTLIQHMSGGHDSSHKVMASTSSIPDHVTSSLQAPSSGDVTSTIRRQRSVERVKIFQIGDQVLIKHLKRSLRNTSQRSSWNGPYRVVELFDDGTCCLQSAKGERRLQHMDNLKCVDQPCSDSTEPPELIYLSALSKCCKTWIPDLNLTMTDRRIIQYGHQLNDKIMDAAQKLISAQYEVEGLDSTLLGQTNTGYDPCAHQCVQIHFDDDRQHWVTSSTTNLRVELCDSLTCPAAISASLNKQLLQRYGALAKGGELTVYILPADQQTNSTDCGVYAIANAVEFLADDGDPIAIYESAAMRRHLIKCLESWDMTPFPKNPKRSRSNSGKVKQYNIRVNKI